MEVRSKELMASLEGDLEVVAEAGKGVDAPDMAVEGRRRDALNISETCGGVDGVVG
jgi:hypothetical protein